MTYSLVSSGLQSVQNIALPNFSTLASKRTSNRVPTLYLIGASPFVGGTWQLSPLGRFRPLRMVFRLSPHISHYKVKKKYFTTLIGDLAKNTRGILHHDSLSYNLLWSCIHRGWNGKPPQHTTADCSSFSRRHKFHTSPFDIRKNWSLLSLDSSKVFITSLVYLGTLAWDNTSQRTSIVGMLIWMRKWHNKEKRSIHSQLCLCGIV